MTLKNKYLAGVESRKALTRKVGSKGNAEGGGDWCPQHTDSVGDSDKKSQPTGGNRSGDDSDADERDERQNAMKFRAQVRNLIDESLHYNCVHRKDCAGGGDSLKRAQGHNEEQQELGKGSLKMHLISVWDRMTHGLIRRLYWVDTRDMLADGMTKGGIDRLLLHRCSNDCKCVAKHEFEPHSKVFY